MGNQPPASFAACARRPLPGEGQEGRQNMQHQRLPRGAEPTISRDCLPRSPPQRNSSARASSFFRTNVRTSSFIRKEGRRRAAGSLVAPGPPKTSTPSPDPCPIPGLNRIPDQLKTVSLVANKKRLLTCSKKDFQIALHFGRKG